MQSSPPLVNQNEISEGRSNRSQTRIEPGTEILQAGVAAGILGAGQLRGRAVVLGDVGVAFEFAGGVGDGELRQRPALRPVFEPESALPSLADFADHGDHDHGQEDKADEDRVPVPQSIESGPVTSALRNCATKAFSESKSSSLGPDSTILPFQSTARKSAIRRAVLRSWLIVR